MLAFLHDIVAMLQASPALFYTYVALIALAFGSFLNVVIYRVPLMMQRNWYAECQSLLDISAPHAKAPKLPARFNLWLPLSHCPSCQQTLAVRDNIPLLSFLWLRGRCRYCQHAISYRYPLVELLTLVLSLIIAAKFGVSLAMLAALAITWVLIAVSFIDIDHLFIPDEMVYGLLWSGLICAIVGIFVDLETAVIGAIAGYLSLWVIAKAFKLITRKDGMGHGDFKLTAAMGAWLGWQPLPFMIFLGATSGLVIGLVWLVAKGHHRDQPIPFGPFLALAGWLLLVFGSDYSLLQWTQFKGY